MRADLSSKAPNELLDLVMLQVLHADPSAYGIQAVEDHFIVEGPSGSHRFLIYLFAGPSAVAVTDCTGRVSRSRRLRETRSVAKQTATARHRMHTRSAGFAHGGGPTHRSADIAISNILFRVPEHILEWSDAEVYADVGMPEMEEVRTRDGHPRGAIESSRLADASIIQENIDFGQSYAIVSQPKNHEFTMVTNYQSPEARFEGRVGLEADVWALGCAILGFSLFNSFFGNDSDILWQSVETLGRFPDP